MVSVNTKEPDTKATPMTMAREVRTSRTLLIRSPARATLSMSVPERLHGVEDRVCTRIMELVDDVAVVEEDHPVGV